MDSNQSRGVLKLALFLALLGQGASEMTRELDMCGKWIHGKTRYLWFDVSRGCENIIIAANETTLSVQGKITEECENSSTIPLPSASDEAESRFCVFWEPVLDLLQVQIGERNFTLCKTAALQKSCCSSLSPSANTAASGTYGIREGSTKGDVIEANLQESYKFFGTPENCQEDLCSVNSPELIEQVALRSGVIGQVDLPCAQVSTQKLEEGFQGLEVILKEPQTSPLRSELSVSVWLPPSVVPREDKGATAVLTYYTESTLFQGPKDRVLSEVVGISVGNRVVSNLRQPVRIVFHHTPVAENESTRCVFWDAKKDPAGVVWRDEGCNTTRRKEETECHCDHLTYFAVLVELNPGSPVDNLEALTYITSVCCAISLCSCVALIILHTRELRRKRDTENSSVGIHRNLAVALLLLCTLFLLTGVVANVAGEAVCRVVGAALHYALLCSFSWMAIEVFIAYWLVRLTRKDFPGHRLFNLLGFGLPALPVIVFVCINDVYGSYDIAPSDDIANPYRMCWIKHSGRGGPVHFITNVASAVALVFMGLVMLVLVLRMVLDRREWGLTWFTFISLWGLTSLFGCTWALGGLRFGPLDPVATFLFCIINSLQGFLLLVRYLLLNWTRYRSVTESSSAASTQEKMLSQTK